MTCQVWPHVRQVLHDKIADILKVEAKSQFWLNIYIFFIYACINWAQKTSECFLFISKNVYLGTSLTFFSTNKFVKKEGKKGWIIVWWFYHHKNLSYESLLFS